LYDLIELGEAIDMNGIEGSVIEKLLPFIHPILALNKN
jgi:hypothetical protein